MHFDHIQSTLFSIPPRFIPLPYSLNFVSSLFKFYILKDIWNSLCYLYILGWVVFHWSIDDLPKLIHLRLSLFSKQLSIANNALGTGGISCPHPLFILRRGQSWVCAGCMQVVSLQMWVHVQLPWYVQKSLFLWPLIILKNLLFNIPWAWWRTDNWFRGEHSAVFCLLYLDQL